MLTLTWWVFLTCFKIFSFCLVLKCFILTKNDDGDVNKYDDELIVLIIITTIINKKSPQQLNIVI